MPILIINNSTGRPVVIIHFFTVEERQRYSLPSCSPVTATLGRSDARMNEQVIACGVCCCTLSLVPGDDERWIRRLRLVGGACCFFLEIDSNGSTGVRRT